MRRTTLLALPLLLTLVVSACTTAETVDTITTSGTVSPVLTAGQVDAIYANAVNQNGWVDVDPPTWAALASEACDLGAWDPEVNAGLTERFLADLGMVDRPNADQVPGIIWMNLHVACHDLVPASASPLPGWLGGATAPAETTPVTGAFVSPSLERVEGMRPNEWPWFSDRVPVPLDAVVGGGEFVDVLHQVPALADYKILSAEREEFPGDERDLELRLAWLKMSNQELLSINTQLLVIEGASYPRPGIRDTKWSPGFIYTMLIIGNRQVGVSAHATQLGGELSVTSEDLLEIAEQIILLYEIQP